MIMTLNPFDILKSGVCGCGVGLESCRCGTSRAFMPRVDLIETDEHFEFVFEVPGVSKDDLKVSIEDRKLTVSAKRMRATEGRRHMSEIVYGACQRSFALPKAADLEDVKAQYQDGLLRITMGKAKESKARVIEVK